MIVKTLSPLSLSHLQNGCMHGVAVLQNYSCKEFSLAVKHGKCSVNVNVTNSS